jgi:hypothetical protein
MKRKSYKKEYIIITKEDIAYLQNFIIEFAATVAEQGVDTALLNLGTQKIQKILKKIRNIEKKKLYLSINKNITTMNFNDEPTFSLPFKMYNSSLKADNTNERIDSIIAPTRLLAAKYFAKRKCLSLKNYLSIYKVSK